MLADHAQAVGGKLYICGGGWSITGPEPSPSAIVLDIKVPWVGINVDHTFRLDLVDADGQPVEVETPEHGLQPLMIEGQFQVTPTYGAAPGLPLDALVAINMGPQPAIAPGGRYEWRLAIDGQTHEDWRLAFSTRKVPLAQTG
jgi:hypothetical protein